MDKSFDVGYERLAWAEWIVVAKLLGRGETKPIKCLATRQDISLRLQRNGCIFHLVASKQPFDQDFQVLTRRVVFIHQYHACCFDQWQLPTHAPDHHSARFDKINERIYEMVVICAIDWALEFHVQFKFIQGDTASLI